MIQVRPHPEGMPETTNLAPLSGCEPDFMHEPVVALRLPPANLLNRFAVNQKKQHADRQTLQFALWHTRALYLSMNQNCHERRRPTARAKTVISLRFSAFDVIWRIELPESAVGLLRGPGAFSGCRIHPACPPQQRSHRRQSQTANRSEDSQINPAAGTDCFWQVLSGRDASIYLAAGGLSI